MTNYNILTVPIDLGGIWHWGWAFGLLAALLYKIRPKAEYLLQAYITAYAIFILEAPRLPYGDYTRAFQVTAAQVALEILLVVSVAASFHAKLWKLIPVLAILECVAVWYQRAGVMGWESFDTALIALCLPFSGWAVQVLGVITIATHHGFTAWMILLAGAVAITPWRKAHWSIYPLTAIPGAMAFWIITRPRFPWYIGIAERLHHWQRDMTLWAHQGLGTILFGTGPGSFQWLSILQDQGKRADEIFLQLHNDWLQILFEEGTFGFLLVLAVVVRAWGGVKKDMRARAGLAGVLVFGLTYHPLRFFPSAFLAAMIFSRALYGQGHPRMSMNDWRFLKMMKDLGRDRR